MYNCTYNMFKICQSRKPALNFPKLPSLATIQNGIYSPTHSILATSFNQCK